MVNFAAGYGIDAAFCLQGSGVTESDLLAPEGLITREQELRLVENLMLALPDVPALGFRLGMQYSVATFGIWGFALRTSRNLREAVTRALRYLPLSTAYCRMEARERDDGFAVCFDPEPIPRHVRQFLLERDMATAVNLMREMSLASVQSCGLEFTGPPPDYAAEIAQLSGTEPVFGADGNALCLNRDVMDRSLPTYDAMLVRMLEDQCRQQLERRQQSGVTGQVRAQLLGGLGLVASIEDVAQAMAMSPRSLRRKLTAEGHSFRQLVEAERQQLAEHLLTNSQMTIEEMALHLGYADTASFNRAFRRWLETSPGEYRRRAGRDRNYPALSKPPVESG